MNEKEERENWNSNSLPLVLCVQESMGYDYHGMTEQIWNRISLLSLACFSSETTNGNDICS